jgi:L-rhamnose mutarotase
MQRIAQVIRVRPERIEEYKRLHADVWPQVLDRIRRSHIRNYSIHLHGDLLFSYFEYDGDDLDADLAAMADDEATRQWWEVTDPCQQPMPGAEPGQWWSPMEQVFLMAD